MSPEPIFPVALITDDGSAEVHASFDSVVRSVEVPELATVLLIDSCGRGFSLEAANGGGWFDKILTALGTPARYKMVFFAGSVSPEAIAAAKSALSLRSANPH